MESRVIDATDLEALLKAEIDDAVDYIEQTVGPERAESTRYYRGEPFGNETEGRSQVVSRDVRDSVQRILASLMDVFFGSERAVEFVPEGPEDVAVAEQQTDYVNYVLTQDNPGFSVFYSVFKDALDNKAGVVKWWLDESTEVTYHDLSGLDDAALGMVLGEPGVELISASSTIDEAVAPVALQNGVPLEAVPQIHDVRVRRTRREPRIRIMAVPPEEFLIDRHAKDIDTARYVGHRCYKRFSDLVAMGYDPEVLEEHVAESERFGEAPETRARYGAQGGYFPTDHKNPAERPILYVESYVRIDMDGDDIAELRKVCTLGDRYKVVANDPVAERPFAAFCPDPEPHTFFGSDIADQTKDIQLVRSNIRRSVLDSLSQSLYPRTAVVEGQVNIEDVLNTEVGAIIRQRAPGMVQPFVIPFVGNEALPMDEMLKAERDARIGEHNMALEADALQSTTKSAVNAQVEAATKRLKLIARIFAETGMKRVFQGLLRLAVAHQDKPRVVRLRNEWATVDPAVWNANKDVTVNVGLGHGLAEDRMNTLREALAFQWQVIGTMGPSNPLVGLGHLSTTFGKLAELAGWKDTSMFANRLPPDYQPPPPPPPPPTPEQIIAQVEMAKTQAKTQEEAAKLQFEREKMWVEVGVEIAKLEAQHNKAVDIEKIRRQVPA